MDQSVILILISILSAVFFVIGVPIFLCIGYWVVLTSLAVGFTISNIGTTAYQSISSWALLAMPLFILTGDLILAAGIAQKLVRFARSCISFIRGATSMGTIFASGLFAAISGSNAATTAAIGSIMIPEMKSEGYNENFAACTAAAGGTVGILIPPSIVFVVYGFLMNLSIADLFLAGIIPGTMVVVALMGSAYYWSRKYSWGNTQKLSAKNILVTAWDAKLGFLAIFLVMYGIYTGKFSPTEASGVTAAYCLLAGIFLTRKIKITKLSNIMLRSAMVNGLLAPIIAISIVMQQMISILGAKETIEALITSMGGYWPMLLAMMFLVLCFGTIFESIPDTIILAPILAPIAASNGIDPIHFACIFLIGDAIGFITPPYGLNLYVASGITGIPYHRLLRYVTPYFLSMLVVWLIVAIFPFLSTWLPSLAAKVY